ncbi:type II secretion system protein [Longimicrobium sp.]|uniref:type II secretion system protein n=1 Tax=Longimicrobium sp. TaxID=2029185 RepID=UPI003B3A0865
MRWTPRVPGEKPRARSIPSYPRTPVPSYSRSRCRAGAVLLEAIVALVILAVAGTSAVTLVSQSADAVRRARVAEAEMREAGAFFHAVALWTRDDLDRRLGERRQGEWMLIIQRPAPTLYEVVLADSALAREILRTTLYRPEPPKPELALPGSAEEAAAGGIP